MVDIELLVGGVQVLTAMVQVLTAIVLAWYTKRLSKSTDRYADITDEDLKLKEKTRQIERLHKELDNLIGPLYSKLGYDSILPDQNFFNSRVVWGSQCGSSPTPTQKVDRSASIFWSDIKKNLYLTTPETRNKITPYLKIKVGLKKCEGEATNQTYIKDMKNITDAVVDRYEKLTSDLSKLENGEK